VAQFVSDDVGDIERAGRHHDTVAGAAAVGGRVDEDDRGIGVGCPPEALCGFDSGRIREEDAPLESRDARRCLERGGGVLPLTVVAVRQDRSVGA
jgi:hypothetical protein